MGFKRNLNNIYRRIKKVYRLENKYKITELKEVLKNNSSLHFNSSVNPVVSIIIPFYNEENYTKNCLVYLQKNLTENYPYEIILIDDNSPDQYDFSTISGIQIIKNEENLGFLKNINKGIKASKGEYIYILNNDTEVQENFLDELFFVFENFKNVGAVGSKLINPDNSLQEAGSVFMKDCNISQIVGKKQLFDPDINYIYKVDYCSGCSLLFKKNDENGNLNLFDEQFAPAYFEETDFCFQLKYLQKKDVYFTPFSKVLHFNGVSYNSKKQSSSDSIKRKEELFNTNLLKFKNKWQKEIDAIQSTKVETRVRELYDNKSIVIFTEIVPEYDKDSGSNRLKEIILAFKELGFHIILVVRNNFIDNRYNEFYQRLGVCVFYEYKKIKSIAYFFRKQKLDPSIVWFYSPDTFSKNISITTKMFPNSKLIFDMVDIHHLRYKRAIELEPKRLSLKNKYKKYKHIELELSKKADYIVAVSDAEKKYMENYFDEEKVITISNIHYTKIKKEDTLPFEERKDILFIGSIHDPNIDALYFLYNDIMPIVWKEYPEIKVNVIGNVNTRIQNINHPNFIFHGYVKDIEYFFASNKLMVAPLRYGAGIKGKIGQAFEYFLPVVTTSIGAEGMKLTDHQNALINDDGKDFAKAIIKLYTDKSVWLTLQNNSENSLHPFSKENLKNTISQIIK